MADNVVAISRQNRQALMPSLLAQGTRLIDARWSFRPVTSGDGSTAMRHVRFPAPTEVEAATLTATRRELLERLRPCQDAALMAMLARLANHHHGDRTTAEWAMLFEDYLDDLAEFSEATLAQAIREHRRSSKWFPKVSELRAKCLAAREADSASWPGVNV